jgi:hypothetical protein
MIAEPVAAHKRSPGATARTPDCALNGTMPWRGRLTAPPTLVD